MSVSPCRGCKPLQCTGFCQMKWTHEKLNVTRLLSSLPALPSSSVILHPVVDTHPYFLFILIVILGHLQIYFFILASLCCVCVFSASHTCEAETTKRQEREEEICSVFRTSSQDGRCVEAGIRGA